MMDDRQLREIEAFAKGITHKAGAILLDHFQRPMEVEYKSENQTNPVTDADKRSEEYLKEAILKEFSDHAILAEEGSQVDSQDSGFTWVIDPLDGTSNFLNGLPVFGVSVGMLQWGKPVVGCIFVPSLRNPAGNILHARRGGGAFCGDEPIRVSRDLEPQRGRATIFPGSYARVSHLRKGFRKQIGELRTLGSVAYEVALTASGVVQYSLFSSPWVWDVAAGIVLVTEAEGVALIQRQNRRYWEPFQGFSTQKEDSMAPEELKGWRTAWLFGNEEMTRYIISHMVPRSRFGLVVAGWLRRWLY